MSDYYVASCVYTSRFPERSQRIQKYVRDRWGFEIVRCCVPKYKLKEFETKMPEGPLRDSWVSLADSYAFQSVWKNPMILSVTLIRL